LVTIRIAPVGGGSRRRGPALRAAGHRQRAAGERAPADRQPAPGAHPGLGGRVHAGYAESNATFGLPPVSGLTGLTSLLNGVTKVRVWQATPGRWRVDVLSDAGERDTYQLSAYRSFIWNSGGQLLTEVRGPQVYRLPRAADLVPPALALRLLSEGGRQARFSVIAPP
jgi:hypothetical protein